jgi:glycosyltransferase involved in cell wall biosynthesis
VTQTSLRILYIIDEMEAITAGGTERQILQMIEMVRNEGADSTLCLLRGTEWVDAELQGVSVVRFNLRSLLSIGGLREMWRIYRWMRREQFDVVHSFFVEANIVAPILGWCAGAPVRIGSRRNLNHWMTFPYRMLQSFSNLFVTRLAANCDAVRNKVEATEFFSRGKIDVTYNGLDTEHFRPDMRAREQQRAALGIAPTEIVIGNTSTLRTPKGVDDFLRAAAPVVKTLPAKILLVGDGPLKGGLERLARELGVLDRTIFAGAQTDVGPWLAAMDVAVMSSHAEGFSNSILEYMACGLPCVVSDVGGNAEAVSECGIVTPVGDVPALSAAILELAQSQQLREQLGACARNRALLFSLPSTQQSLIDYYRKLRASR